MAAALVALNQVFGNCYDVTADEVDDQQALSRKRWPKNQFIFDMQTHHVDVSRKWYDDTPQGRPHDGLLPHAAARRKGSTRRAWSSSTGPITSRRSSATATR